MALKESLLSPTPRRPVPYDAWSWPAQFLFLYVTPVLVAGSRKGRLVLGDIPVLAARDEPASNFVKFDAIRGSIAGRLFAMFWAPWLYSGALLLLTLAGQMGSPLLLHAFLSYLSTPGAAPQTAYLLALGLGACSALAALTIHKFWWEAQRVGVISRFVLSTAVLRATLGLGNAARGSGGGGLSRGKLLNHMAIDTARLDDNYVLPFLHWNTWGAALTVGVSVYNLWRLMGPAGVVACAALAVFVPLSTLIARGVKRVSEGVQQARDVRGRLIGEAVAGIQTLKAYGWEGWLAGQVAAVRGREMRGLIRKQYFAVASSFMGSSMLVLVLAGTFAYYTLVEGKALDAPTAFAAIGWVNQLQMPLSSVPNTITALVDSRISLRRLKELFAAEAADVSGMSQWTQVLHREAGRRSRELAASQQKKGLQNQTQLRALMEDWLDLEALEQNARQLRESEQAAADETDGSGDAATGGPCVHAFFFAMKPAGHEMDDTSSAAGPPVELCGASFGWSYRDEEEDSGATPASSTNAAAKPPDKSCEKGTANATTPSDMGAVSTAADAVLKDVTFSCPRGSLTLVIGAVGSGKSTLVSGLVGDADRLGGYAFVQGAVAFAGQYSWVLNRTLRENVTFTSEYKPAWYDTVMAATCLDRDAATFKRGHDQMVGDSGITLSGGQRQRVALARAVYANADVVILDDVLSAVDSTTGAHIWRACILDLLLRRGKTVVMATHAVHYAAWPEVYQLVVLVGGTVAGVGSYAELRGAFPVLLGLEEHDTRRLGEEGAGHSSGGGGGSSSNSSSSSDALAVGAAGHRGRASAGACDMPQPLPATTAAREPALSPALREEEAAQEGAQAPSSAPAPEGSNDEGDDDTEAYARGAVSGRHVWRYVRSCGSWGFLCVLGVLFLAAQVLTVLSSWWVAKWTGAAADAAGGGRSAVFYASVYAGLSATLVLLSLGRMLLISYGSLQASTTLHNAALRAVLLAPAGWFARTPAGRIANRFLSDVSTIDNSLRGSLSALLTLVLTLVAVTVVLGVFVPVVLAVMAILSLLYVKVGQLYRVSARDLRRLHSTTKSPVLAHYAEALRGLPVIRAFGPAAAAAVVARHLALCRDNARAAMTYMDANEWVSTMLEFIGACVIVSSCIFTAWEHSRGRMSVSEVGFVLTYTTQFPGLLMWAVRQLTLVETDAVSVERLAEFADLPPEAGHAATPAATPPAPPPAVSPAPEPRGGCCAELELADVWLRYAPHLPWVLRGLSLRIPAGAKVAVLGATGCGKSTTFQALLRLYPAEKGALRLRIHGSSGAGFDTSEVVDLGALSCADARAHVTALLQDGFLFSGSVRDNLLGPAAAAAAGAGMLPPGSAAAAAADALLWAVLARVGAAGVVKRIPGALDGDLGEQGGSLSAGERALLCLARAVLRQERGSGQARSCVPSLVLADEPTSSVDLAADAAVHDTLLALPQTVLCICHRLHHVPRFGLVAVLAAGAVAELGPPAQLAARPGSLYAQLLASAARSRADGAPEGEVGCAAPPAATPAAGRRATQTRS